MDVRAALKGQYHAALKTLREAVDKCPDAMWDAPKDWPATFWRVTYHVLFFTHFYLQADHQSFTPWARHSDEANIIGGVPWENNRPPRPCEPYTKADLLAYWAAVDGMIDAGVDALDLAAPESGFPWYKISKLEHQIVNIRHAQHHAAALATRLRREAGLSIGWVGHADAAATA
jgi:hypothetical protein